jgi:polyphosphate kinase
MCFGAGRRRKKLFISSADWMTRNTQRRVELGIPILSRTLAEQLYQILTVLWNDTVKARELEASGQYHLRLPQDENRLNSQEFFMSRQELKAFPME